MTEHDLSYVHGVSDAPLSGETIGRYFDRVTQACGDQEALVARQQGIRWNWRELGARIDSFAAGLIALGLEPGDRLAIWVHNRAEWPVTQFAAAKAGLVLVNINPAARASELQRYLNLVEARALVMQDAFKSSDYLAMLQTLLPELAHQRPGELDTAAVPTLRLVIRLGEGATTGMLHFDDVGKAATPQTLGRLAKILAAGQCDDPVNIQFSSATGEHTAGATLTHHNLLNNGFICGQTLRLSAADRVCLPVPLFHCFGMVMGNMACLAHGATIVYPGDTFDASETLATIAAERCTACYGVPAMFTAMLEAEDFTHHDIGSLRTGIMAGAPCPVETMHRVIDAMHMAQVTIAYGMTETSPVSFMCDIDDSVEHRVATVGTIRAHTEAKIIDADGRMVPRDTPGEVCIRGYNVMRGYWNDRAYTARVIDAAGWLHTGDLAELDAGGYCRIVGGVKDTVIRGGENISPVEVEEFLAGHEAIAEAVVVGVPDRRLGEELCACIRAHPGKAPDAQTVRAFCSGNLAHHKIPRYVCLFETFPSSPGRARRYLLREQAVAALGLEKETEPT